MNGIFNILLGLFFIGAGLSEKLVLMGTDSPMALAVVGGFLVLWGGYQAFKGATTTYDVE